MSSAGGPRSRRAGRGLAAALAAGTLLACVPARRDSLTILLTDDILALDPNQEVQAVTDSVLFNVYDPLVAFDENLNVRTVLAESWEHPSPEQWRFHLRKGVRFQDGTPLTAALVREALLSVKQSAHLEASQFMTPVKDVVTVDDWTVDLVTAEPRAILASLTFLYVAKKNAAGGFPPLAGTGPYRLREWKPGERVVLERWERFWGPRPRFREVVFVPLPDPRGRLARLAEGSADIAYAVPAELATARPPGVTFVRRSGLTVSYIGFNLRPTPGNPFRDRRVREALHLSIDRAAIVERVLRGWGQVATQPVAPAIFGYDPALRPAAYDPESARRLLAAAGHARGLRTRLDFSTPRLPAARLIQEQLRRVGVEAALNTLERDAVYDLAKEGRSDLFLVGWDCSSGEASEFYEFLLHTPSARYGLGNHGGYSDRDLDRIAETNTTILDTRARQSLLQEAARIVMRDLPILPLVIEDDVYGVRGGIRFRPRADGEIRAAEVADQGS